MRNDCISRMFRLPRNFNFFFVMLGIGMSFTTMVVSATPPVVNFTYAQSQGTFGSAYNDSITNLTVINTIGNPSYFRAGGDYNDSWTRDGSLNSWNAGSLLDPVTAKNTLVKLIKNDPTYGQIIDQGNRQWWDMVIWIPAAWNYFQVTGDTNFLSTAYMVATDTLNTMRSEHYNSAYGLFKGPSFFNDGIAGYPLPYNNGKGSSFVLDHPGTDQLMCLSVNCLYYDAYRTAALMGNQLGKPRSVTDDLNDKAADLKTQINSRFWIKNSHRYGYFIHGTGPLTGTLVDYQEGSGLAFAILFGVADDTRAQTILNNIHFEPKGLPSIWPNFSMFSDSQPGRHNNVIWPQVNGLFAKAAAHAKDYPVFSAEFERITKLFNSTPGNIREIYNATSGLPDGGWQNGGHWGAAQNQTWSATAYLNMVFNGIFGMNFTADGITFSPYLKSQWGPVSLNNLKYRNMILDINISGNGNYVSSFKLDNVIQSSSFISASLTGNHTINITLGDGSNIPSS
jgi:glycogen debranching enzyme